jgi:death on curing protein
MKRNGNSSAPRLPTTPLVRAMHAALLARFGGLAGTVDEGKLGSALARAQQRMAYGDPPPTVYELAAECAFGIARNHPFSDGNKRVALATADMALWLNGIEFTAGQAETVVVVQSLAAGELSVEQLAAWLEQNSVKAKRRR